MADNLYGRAAIRAADLAQTGAKPDDAWDEAVRLFTQSQSVRDKSCPRSTFLGLCAKGYVKGIDPGVYTASNLISEYGVKAVELLIAEPANSDLKPSDLWKLVWPSKRHNGQMDVVLGCGTGA